MSKESKLIRQLTPIGAIDEEALILPNHSGDHDAGILRKTPTQDRDLVNKAYVDSQVISNHALLNNLNSANYTHLTAVQATDLTDGGQTVLHTHPSSSTKTKKGVYMYSLTDQAGQAGAYVFFVLSNPIGSGRFIKIKKLNINGYAVAISTTKIGVRISRAYSVLTGGTLASPDTIAKLDTEYPTPSGEVRTANPTVYQIGDIQSRCPAAAITVANLCGGYGYEVDLDPRESVEEMYLREGQSISVYQSGVGAVGNTYNINIKWEEEA